MIFRRKEENRKERLIELKDPKKRGKRNGEDKVKLKGGEKGRGQILEDEEKIGRGVEGKIEEKKGGR